MKVTYNLSELKKEEVIALPVKKRKQVNRQDEVVHLKEFIMDDLDLVIDTIMKRENFGTLPRDVQVQTFIMAAETVMKNALEKDEPFFLATIIDAAGTSVSYVDTLKDPMWMQIKNHYKRKAEEHLNYLALMKKIDNRAYQFYMINNCGKSMQSDREKAQKDRELDIKEMQVMNDANMPNVTLDLDAYIKGLNNADKS